MPSDRKKRRTIFDAFFSDFFGEDLFEDADDFFGSGLKNAGTGYSMQISQINGETVVTVKAYGQVDRKALERELKEKYPNARINIELYNENGERKPFIEEVTANEKNTEIQQQTKKQEIKQQKSSFSLFGPQRHVMIEEIKTEEEEDNKKGRK